jgi:outer membrane protein assembly factor BamB
VAWEVEANARYSSPLVSSDDRVFVGTLDGRLCSYALADGRCLGEVALGGWVYASPVPGGNGLLYAGASDGLFRAIV